MGGFGDFSLSEIVATAVVFLLFVVAGYAALFWIIAQTSGGSVKPDDSRGAKNGRADPRKAAPRDPRA